MMLKNGVFITLEIGGLSEIGQVIGHVTGWDYSHQNSFIGFLEMNKMLFYFH